MKKIIILCIVLLPFFIFAQKKKGVTKCTDMKSYMRTHTQKMEQKGYFLVLLDTDMYRGEDNVSVSPFETQFVEYANKCFKGMTYAQVSKYLGPAEIDVYGNYIYHFKGKFDGQYYRYYSSFRISKRISTIKDVWIHGNSQTPPEIDTQ